MACANYSLCAVALPTSVTVVVLHRPVGFPLASQRRNSCGNRDLGFLCHNIFLSCCDDHSACPSVSPSCQLSTSRTSVPVQISAGMGVLSPGFLPLQCSLIRDARSKVYVRCSG